MPQKTWNTIHQYVEELCQLEPLMADYFQAAVLDHNNIIDALSWIIVDKLSHQTLAKETLSAMVKGALQQSTMVETLSQDLNAIKKRDGACKHIAMAFLFYKGFHSLQVYRVAHYLWNNSQHAAALLFQSRCSAVFNVDIHPAAVLGKGIMIDHATGIVIGETARVGDNVSIMQSVTLGGTGKEHDDRHPKIASGVLISCGAKILGNINVGEGAKIAAGSVVLKDVAPHTTVAGVPAQVIGQPSGGKPALDMIHSIDCDSVNITLKNIKAQNTKG